jgi:CHAT domain-containing protein
LPGTLQEVEEIASQWSAEAGAGANAEVVFLTGATATDSAFAVNASRKRRLHLATHGFFVDARCAVPDAPGDDPSSNPLQLSGLAFSRPDGKHDSTNDGFLIAEEIAALDLHGVECAVLSACETGVGNVVTGEGILGLRRAFQVAGVRTVIMSLWAVSDEPTRDWMRALYSAQLQQRLGTVTAVQQAYLRSLEARRKRQASCAPCEACSTHPFFWASFVAAGEWR